MDAFSEILSGLNLNGAVFFNAQFSAPWGFSTPSSQVMRETFAPDELIRSPSSQGPPRVPFQSGLGITGNGRGARHPTTCTSATVDDPLPHPTTRTFWTALPCACTAEDKDGPPMAIPTRPAAMTVNTAFV